MRKNSNKYKIKTGKTKILDIVEHKAKNYKHFVA